MEQKRTGQPDIGALVVRIKGIDLFTGSSGEQPEHQLSRHAALIMPVSGSAEVMVGTEERLVRPDHAVVCPPGGTFAIRSKPGEELSLYVIRFELLELREEDGEYAAVPAGEAVFLDWNRVILLQPPGKAAELCREIHRTLYSRDGRQRLRAQLDGAELIYLLLSGAAEPAEGGTAEALQRAKAFLDDRYQEDISMERLASIAGLSSKYASDLFKRTFGQSPLDYLSQVRMREAKRLMLQTDWRMRDIAHAVGYRDEFFFSRKFKQSFGLSPSAYVKKRSVKVAAYGSAGLTGYLLPLGIIPYAAPLHPKWSGYYCDRYGADIAVHLDAYRHNHYKEANLKRLELARPDRIITGWDLEEEELWRLNRVAPVHSIRDDCLDWRKELRELAELLGEQAEAERWIDAFDQKVREKKQRFKRLAGEETVMVVKLLKNQLYVYRDHAVTCLLHRELEFRAAGPGSLPAHNQPISLEELDNMNPGRVLLLICKETETLDYWKQLQASSAWVTLRIVKENRVRQIASEPWREYSPVALQRMLEDTERIFSGDCPSGFGSLSME
ncbi:helix-turn-helix domain-containing protein [Paenibacillus sp. CN-4]|uniref:helix-turn-helix domain-containing protein n=1 Tax=Paenibacillus nanchangensis TaxID=3348343 RepID=UPI00397B78AD